MAIVAVERALNVGRHHALMAPEKNRAWARVGSVANKALNELAYRRGGDQGRVCNDGGFNSAPRRSISFVLASVTLVPRDEIRGGAPKVNTRPATETTLSPQQRGYPATHAPR